MESSSSELEVKIISKCFVKPKILSEKWKEPYHITLIDHILLPKHYIQKGFFLSNHHFLNLKMQFKRLEESLATTLVHFFPLAGRLSTLKTNSPRPHSVFVDCNNSPGAGFIHAKSDLRVSDIVGSKYVPLVAHSFLDHHEALNRNGYTTSLLSLQVTKLVDGVFLGLSMNHSIGDGTSFCHFFNSLSEIFNSKDETIDNDNKKLFGLKNPPLFREMTGPLYSLPFSQPDESFKRYTCLVWKERIFHFSSEAMKSLKLKANQECGITKISSFQSLTTFMWRSIIKARNLPNDQETTFNISAGNRSRMNPPASENYFGNYVSLVSTTTNVANILENKLGWTALKLHQAIIEHTGEKISYKIEQWLKSQLERDGPSCPNVVHIGSSLRLNVYGCEFEIGKAVAVRSGYDNSFSEKIIDFPGREGGGSIDLEVCLLPEFMEALESDQEFMSFVSS